MNRFTTGRVYYGDTLKRILAKNIDRADKWYLSRLWPAYLLVGIGLMLIAATIAIIICGGL